MSDFEVYTIIEGKDKDSKNFWCRIGTGWLNKDDSINIRLNALPTNSTLHVRRPSEDRDRRDNRR